MGINKNQVKSKTKIPQNPGYAKWHRTCFLLKLINYYLGTYYLLITLISVQSSTEVRPISYFIEISSEIHYTVARLEQEKGGRKGRR